MRFSGKFLLLAGFITILLIGIPVTLYLLQQQQESRSKAQAATVLSFDPTSSTASPIQKQVGDSIPLSIVVNPGTNLVGWIRVVLTYDPTKLALATTDQFKINPSTSFSFFNGPVYSNGKIEAELSVGADPTKAIQSPVTLATITFKALAGTNGTPTTIEYSSETQATSLGTGDQANENVLSTTIPAAIVIGGSSSITPTLPAAQPTIPPAATLTPVPTTSGGAGGATPNVIPICSSLNVDRATTGTAPLSLTFTANGTDSDGTITRVTFDYGDGVPVIVTSAGGIGTNIVAVQNAHTYANAGSYIVKATLTDDRSGVSEVGGCTQTVVVQAAASTGSGSTTSNGTSSASGSGTSLPATGPSNLMIGIGAIAGMLTLIGTVLFFAL